MTTASMTDYALAAVVIACANWHRLGVSIMQENEKYNTLASEGHQFTEVELGQKTAHQLVVWQANQPLKAHASVCQKAPHTSVGPTC